MSENWKHSKFESVRDCAIQWKFGNSDSNLEWRYAILELSKGSWDFINGGWLKSNIREKRKQMYAPPLIPSLQLHADKSLVYTHTHTHSWLGLLWCSATQHAAVAATTLEASSNGASEKQPATQPACTQFAPFYRGSVDFPFPGSQYFSYWADSIAPATQHRACLTC